MRRVLERADVDPQQLDDPIKTVNEWHEHLQDNVGFVEDGWLLLEGATPLCRFALLVCGADPAQAMRMWRKLDGMGTTPWVRFKIPFLLFFFFFFPVFLFLC